MRNRLLCRGDGRIRTAVQGFAGLCLATRPRHPVVARPAGLEPAACGFRFVSVSRLPGLSLHLFQRLNEGGGRLVSTPSP